MWLLFSSVKCSRSLVVGAPAPPKKRPPPFVQSPASRIIRQYTNLIPYKFHYFPHHFPHSSLIINTSLNSNANFENERAVLMWHLLLFWLGPNRRAASRRLASIYMGWGLSVALGRADTGVNVRVDLDGEVPVILYRNAAAGSAKSEIFGDREIRTEETCARTGARHVSWGSCQLAAHTRVGRSVGREDQPPQWGVVHGEHTPVSIPVFMNTKTANSNFH